MPELASRQHVRDICGVVERALEQAQVTLDAVDAIAVTQGPGLVGSLLVGRVVCQVAGRGARRSRWCPCTIWPATSSRCACTTASLPLPAVVLVVSGGHTSLYLVPSAGVYELLGRTRDDAAGEAYDKVARLLGLGYPGGPVIDRLAQRGNDRAVDLPVTRITHRDRNAPGAPGTRDFSYSGLKTAVLRHVEQCKARGAWPLPEAAVADLCASFQRVVVESLLDRLFEAARAHGAASVGVAGGVSANSRLRADAVARGAARGPARVHPEPGAVHRQRRDDRRRRPPALRRRRPRRRRPECRRQPRADLTEPAAPTST